jgi:hypothetical protein
VLRRRWSLNFLLEPEPNLLGWLWVCKITLNFTKALIFSYLKFHRHLTYQKESFMIISVLKIHETYVKTWNFTNFTSRCLNFCQAGAGTAHIDRLRNTEYKLTKINCSVFFRCDLLIFHLNMQAVQKFAGGAKSCCEDAMVTRGLLMFQHSQKSPINDQQNLNIIVGDSSWTNEPFRYGTGMSCCHRWASLIETLTPLIITL